MLWIPSHSEVIHHPKTRKLARRLDISIPTAIGHLHCFWHWAIKYAPEGTLDRYEDEDIAIGAIWDGDPTLFVAALIETGWIDDDRQIHDWDEYGGKRLRVIESRSEAGRKGAEARWQTHGNAIANAWQTHSDANGTALANSETALASDGRVEEIREEEIREEDKTLLPRAKKSAARGEKIPENFQPSASLISWAKENHPTIDPTRETPGFVDHHLSRGSVMKNWEAAWRTWIRNAEKFSAGRAGGAPAPAEPKPIAYTPYEPEEPGCEHGTPMCEDCRKANLAKLSSLLPSFGMSE